MTAGLQQHGSDLAARALAGKEGHAQIVHGQHAALGTIGRERPFELLRHRRAVRFLRHIDEVDGNDAAHVAQAYLAGDLARGQKVGLKDGALQVVFARELARVDVDDRHRLRPVEDEVRAVFEPHHRL